jgi:prepilin-type N-terminal cleavage/methylation domain-containing protein
MRIFNIKGVTLIELLITIGIISTLAVVLVTLINPAETGRKSRDAKRMSDLATIKRAIDMALADKQPLTPAGPLTIDSTNDIGGLNVSKYIPAIPKDPAYSASGNTQVIDKDCNRQAADKSTMVYQYISDGDTYTVRTRFESVSSCTSLTQDGYTSDYYEMGTNLELFDK